MNKKFLFLMFLAIAIMGCETEGKKKGKKANLPKETIIHKLVGGAPLELPKSFEEVKSKENLKVRLKETGNFNAELLEMLGFDLKMHHQLFFDFTSGEKMMYLIIDHSGPRFKLNENSIARQVALIEKQTAQRYKAQEFKLGVITHELTKINGSNFLKFKFKFTLNGQDIYRTIYTTMLKENRRNLTFTFENYNDGEVDLEAFILAFT